MMKPKLCLISPSTQYDMTVSLETYFLCSVLRWNTKGTFYAGQGVVAHSSVDTAQGKMSIKNLNQEYAIEVNQINLLNRQ